MLINVQVKVPEGDWCCLTDLLNEKESYKCDSFVGKYGCGISYWQTEKTKTDHTALLIRWKKNQPCKDACEREKERKIPSAYDVLGILAEPCKTCGGGGLIGSTKKMGAISNGHGYLINCPTCNPFGDDEPYRPHHKTRQPPETPIDGGGEIVATRATDNASDCTKGDGG